MKFGSLALALALTAVPAVAVAQGGDVARVQAGAPFRAAVAELDRDYDRFVAELIELTEIPAPPFKEEARGRAYAAKFRALGLTDVAIDEVGNVTGIRPGTDPRAKLVVMSAHLDTVFPEGTDVKVKREGTKLMAPGIGDDTRGLATVLAYIRALDAAKIRTRAPILFVGTVGEEGRGDLRGVRHLFTKGAYKDRIGAFFSLDGSDPTRVVHGGVGSKRYRIVFKGPGGHSYGAFGIVNPIAAMGRTIDEMYRIELPAKPRTTYAASVTGGGTSVNAIPGEVFLDIDMRSESAEALAALETRVLGIVANAVTAENAARSTRVGKVSADPQPIGDRPAGATPPTDPLVRTTAAAVTAAGFTATLEASSTDANLPMSLGIPAVTIGAGGKAGRAHAEDEWVDIEKGEGVKGMSVGLLALIATAGQAR
ncbi:M20/M25/M40 family metallo-hydrolase [Sphingomonas sp.]|uniref:M20/M25/M40 family metallo-hydrolase n=1 Tax=Sphingomonas sp. TaxID=28214 RepID=UPI002DD64209|nr:M20/M25/M40 family metallo-hydrolase [Sphingomonas sp.]